MKKPVYRSLILVAACCVAVSTLGCKEEHSPGDGHDHTTVPAPNALDAHSALHQTKYNETLVEFPGHKYALEIIDEKETTGLVTAFLTDAHFNPIDVDAKDLRLNFIIGGSPKTFTLTRTEQESGKPATFTLTDMELATLNSDGWQMEATASVEIDGTPYSAKMTKLGRHDHAQDHAHDDHAH